MGSGAKEKKTALIVFSVLLALIFSVILICNFNTPLVSDDYYYCYDFSTGERITNAFQIIDSMKVHRYMVNGKVIPHAFVQFFLMFPKSIFNILNSVVFVAEMVLIVFCSRKKEKGIKKEDVLSLLLAFGLIWLFQPYFGEANLWLDGSVNYLWSSVLFFVFFMAYKNVFAEGCFSSKKWINVCFVIFCFFAGASHEIIGITALMLSAIALLSLLINKKKPDVWFFLSILMTLTGFLTVLLAPVEKTVKLIPLSPLENIEYFFWRTMGWMVMTNRLMPLFCIAVVLLLVANILHVERKVLNEAVMLFFLSAVSYFPFVFGTYLAGRSTALTTAILTMCCLLLIRAILSKKGKKMTILSYVMLGCITAVLVPYLVIGIRDANKGYRFSESNRELIVKNKEEGNLDVTVPDINRDGLSPYCVFFELPYVSREEGKEWPNLFLAKYYGINSLHFNGKDTNF